MADGKSGNQYKHPPDIFYSIYTGKGKDEQLMIQGVGIDNMLPSQFKVKSEVGHCELTVERTKFKVFF